MARGPSSSLAARLREPYDAAKVPQITAFFWILKLISTAMGEATSDFSVSRIDPFAAVPLGGLVFLCALAVQLTRRRYVAWAYWLTVCTVAVFGTMCADALHVQFHVPYENTTFLFALVLAVVFYVWNRSEGTLSIHSIVTPRRELFYWAAVISTFALGTAAGDLVATPLKLGYWLAAVVFGGLILVPALAYWKTRRHEVLWFWMAYVLTRPAGASLADWSDKPHHVGGLNFGDGPVAVVLAVVVVAIVAYLVVTRRDIQPETERLPQVVPPSVAEAT